MKLFVKNIFAFFIIPLIFLIISLLIISFISTKINYKLDNGVTEIYIGDSHIQCAINDSLLKNSKNVSEGSESFYFSYYKLKKLIEENQNIERVYLGFSYHSLSNYNDEFISGKYASSVLPRYIYILPFKEKLKRVNWDFKNLSSFIKPLFPEGYNYLFKNLNFFSACGYKNEFTNVMASKSSMDKRLRFQYYTDEKINKFSEINLLYLDKIINLIKTTKIDLLFLNTPLHPYYESKIPKNYITRYNEIVKLKNLKVINFNDLSFSDSSFLPDGDHVSVKGAYQITNELLRGKHERITWGFKQVWLDRCSNGSFGNPGFDSPWTSNIQLQILTSTK